MNAQHRHPCTFRQRLSLEQAIWSLRDLGSPERRQIIIPLLKPVTRVGASSTCELRITSTNVSPVFAELIVLGELMFVRGLQHSGKILLNGYRVRQVTPVGDGDMLQFGDEKFCLQRRQLNLQNPQCIDGENIKREITHRVSQVIRHRQFHMVYQPIVQAHDLRIVGVEALLRCDQAGLESPLQLFQHALDAGLHQELSSSCREKACEKISQQMPALRLFLNTHPSEILDGKLIRSLAELQEIAGNWKIVVEIHEAAVNDIELVRKFREKTCSLGIELAYDDFGIGQNRWREILESPPDYLKFDRSLVHQLSVHQQHRIEPLSHLINLCHEMGIKVVAEGIESAEDGDMCRELGFDLFQGYYYGRPVRPEELDINYSAPSQLQLV